MNERRRRSKSNVLRWSWDGIQREEETTASSSIGSRWKWWFHVQLLNTIIIFLSSMLDVKIKISFQLRIQLAGVGGRGRSWRKDDGTYYAEAITSQEEHKKNKKKMQRIGKYYDAEMILSVCRWLYGWDGMDAVLSSSIYIAHFSSIYTRKCELHKRSSWSWEYLNSRSIHPSSIRYIHFLSIFCNFLGKLRFLYKTLFDSIRFEYGMFVFRKNGHEILKIVFLLS